MLKFVPLDKSSAGKDVRDVQPDHVYMKFVPLDRFKTGKEVKPVQPYHA